MKASRVLSKAALGFAAVIGSASIANAEISWNGFGSVYYGHALNEDFLPVGFNSADPNLTSFSRFGLNVSGGISQNMDFAAQLIATGGDAPHSGFDVYAQWAFLNYRVGDSTTLRFGRQILPAFIASEYARVGYLLPGRVIPSFETLPFVAFDGVTAEHAWQLGDGMKLTAGIYGGEAIIDVAIPAPAYYTGKNLYGARLTLDGDGWRFHLNGMTNENVTGATGGPVSGRSKAPNYTVGFRYDKHNVVSWTEYLYSRATSGTEDANGNQFSEARNAVYSLIGYRIGDFMPRYTYSYADATTGRGSTQEIFASHTVGLNYQLNPQAVFKIEYEHTDLIQANTLPAAQRGVHTFKTANNADSGGAIYAGIDFVF